MLTVKQIEAARYGVSPVRLSDGNGLYIRLNKGGGKTFQLRLTEGTRTRWITLGRYPDVSLRDARVQAVLKKAGHDSPDQTAPLNTPTQLPDFPEPSGDVPRFQDFAKVWFDRKKQGLSNGKHIEQNWSTLKTYAFPHFGKLPLNEIRQRHIIAAFDPIWRVKHETAKRTLGRVKEVFELAKVLEHAEVNPADFSPQIAFGRVRKETKHHAALYWGRVPELWQWLVSDAREEEDVRQMMMVMLLSAKRTKEVRFMAWDDLDLEARIWTSRAEHMKMRREHRVPVSAQLAQVFENMHLLNGNKDQTFARPRNKSGVICENRARLGFQTFDASITGHGMRTSFRTWARKQGCYAHDVMETALSHEKDQLVQAYMRDDLLEERRALMQDWADYVTGGTMPPRLADHL
ncbi:Integrase [Monaibacterium marinum]|uniref:Integrase n=1 Tax=Pontivivens marinum TaxID=1690039 RepID=A0A2C9CWT9_9RHOB|nr:integrase arm-type DNA-binding domain-containing protein [Monaibacterium marinum]SOH95710.1 Integrase [Monaibacterium marinum]